MTDPAVIAAMDQEPGNLVSADFVTVARAARAEQPTDLERDLAFLARLPEPLHRIAVEAVRARVAAEVAP